MATCAFCKKYIKDGTGNIHHLHFPKKKWKGTRKGRLTVTSHVVCHNRFHYYFLHTCLARNSRHCEGCQYTSICCYYTYSD